MNPEQIRSSTRYSVYLKGIKKKEEQNTGCKFASKVNRSDNREKVYPRTYTQPNDTMKKQRENIYRIKPKPPQIRKSSFIDLQNDEQIKKSHWPDTIEEKNPKIYQKEKKLYKIYGIMKPEGKKEDMFKCMKSYEKSIDLSSKYVPLNTEKIENIEENQEKKKFKITTVKHAGHSPNVKLLNNFVGRNPKIGQGQKGEIEEKSIGNNPKIGQGQKGKVEEKSIGNNPKIGQGQKIEVEEKYVESKQGYKFFRVKNEPHSLVMLKSIENVLPLLLITPVFLLFKCPASTKKKVEAKSLNFTQFDKMGEMKEHIQKKLVRQHIEVLSPVRNAKEIGDELDHCPEIKKFHLYFDEDELKKNGKLGVSPDQALTRLLDLNNYPQRSHILQKHQFSDLKDVLNHWDHILQHKNSKMLPNIVFLNEDGWKGSIQMRTMFAMLNQENTNKQKIMKQLYKLHASVYQTKEKSYKEYQTLNEIISAYTEASSPENIIVNNLLKGCKSHSQIYYCQPYFRQLFKAIQQLYKNQNLSTGTYYRGASASSWEISNYKENVGNIIQNLGFLSTSADKAVGQMFARNLMFVITVKKESRDPDLDYGYADIHRYSFFEGQKEVLFNPLNTFIIDKVEKTYYHNRAIEIVYLTYGSLARIRYRKKSGQLLNKLQEQYAAQAEYLVEGLKEKMENQGDAFLSHTSQYDYLAGGLEYWQGQMKNV